MAVFPVTTPVADALVYVQSAHTSIAHLGRIGTTARDRAFYARLCPLFRRIVVVSYGGAEDAEVARELVPAGWGGRIECECNAEGLEPGVFQASVPRRVASALAGGGGCGGAVVYTDQHQGGEVALLAARELRPGGVRVGVVARCGYHWSWTVAKDTAPDDPRAIAAAMSEGETCRGADVVVATTARIAENLAWQHRLSRERIRVVPNFVSPGVAAPDFAKREPGMVLYAGRLGEEKRVELLIRVVGMAARTVPGLRLVVIGDGPLLDSLRSTASSYHAPVEFRSRVGHEELLREMGRCSIYAQLSRFEGHPKTILEAMAMGAPTLVTRAPGVDDEINPNVTGIVTGDAEGDVAGALVWLAQNPEIARRIGTRAARDIRSRLSLEHTFPKLEACFRLAMELGGRDVGSHATTPVRWDQTLLNAGPDGAAAEFGTSIGGYAKRLDPRLRTMFLDAVAARLGSLVEDGKEEVRPPDARASRP